MLLYPVTLRPDGNSVVVLFPDFSERGHTNGTDEKDALHHAPDPLKAIISMLIEKNLDIPRPGRSARKGVRLIGLPSVIDDAKVELYMALRKSGIRKAELARRMGIHKQQVERLFDLDPASRIEQLEAAFEALGLKLAVSVAAAA
jgi:antitoxin HicB